MDDTLHKVERYNNKAVIMLYVAIFIMAIASAVFGSVIGMFIFLVYGQVLILFWLHILFG